MLCPRRIPLQRFMHSIRSSFSTVALSAEHYAPTTISSKGPLVILHGLYGSKQNWRGLAKGLANQLNRSVYALDLRNHGASPHAEGTSYSEQAADVKRFIEENELQNVVLAGHSMGGKVAMALALSDCAAIERLIVVDMSPGVGKVSDEFANYIAGMKEIESARVHSRKEADEVLKKYEPNLGVRQFLLTNLDRTDASSPYSFRLPLDILKRGLSEIGEFPYAPEEKKWNGPALFLKGERSKYINRRNIPLIDGFFPNNILKVIDAGHWVHAEKPKEFIQEIVTFCE